MSKYEVNINRELLPSSKGERSMGLGGYFALWIGFAVIIATFSVGGSGVSMMTLPLVIVECVVGNLITGLLITLNGDVGQEHGIPSPIYWCVIYVPGVDLMTSPGAVSFQTFVNKLFNKNLPYKVAVIIVGVIALLVQPWAIMEKLTLFLGYMGSVYGPIAGIMIADYWILAKFW